MTDFGVVSIRNHLTSSAAFHPDNIQEVNGTLRWMAPERLDGQPLKRSSDLYSFAITAWELYSGGAIPFADVPDGLLARVVVENERRPPRPASLGNNDLWSIIRASWLPDPDKRPTFSELYPKLKTLSHLRNFFSSLLSRVFLRLPQPRRVAFKMKYTASTIPLLVV